MDYITTKQTAAPKAGTSPSFTVINGSLWWFCGLYVLCQIYWASAGEQRQMNFYLWVLNLRLVFMTVMYHKDILQYHLKALHLKEMELPVCASEIWCHSLKWDLNITPISLGALQSPSLCLEGSAEERSIIHSSLHESSAKNNSTQSPKNSLGIHTALFLFFFVRSLPYIASFYNFSQQNCQKYFHFKSSHRMTKMRFFEKHIKTSWMCLKHLGKNNNTGLQSVLIMRTWAPPKGQLDAMREVCWHRWSIE